MASKYPTRDAGDEEGDDDVIEQLTSQDDDEEETGLKCLEFSRSCTLAPSSASGHDYVTGVAPRDLDDNNSSLNILTGGSKNIK